MSRFVQNLIIMKTLFKNLLILCILTTIFSCNSYGEKLEFDGTEVYYMTKVTKEEANKLGAYLVSSKFADGKEKSVQLTKDDKTNHFAFRMVTNEKAAKDSTYHFIFRVMAMQISDSVFGGKPVDFHVCDNTFKTLKVLADESK